MHAILCRVDSLLLGCVMDLVEWMHLAWQIIMIVLTSCVYHIQAFPSWQLLGMVKYTH